MTFHVSFCQKQRKYKNNLYFFNLLFDMQCFIKNLIGNVSHLHTLNSVLTK